MKTLTEDQFKQQYGNESLVKLSHADISRFPDKASKDPFVNRFTKFVGLGGATDVFGSLLARQGIGTDTPTEITQESIEKPTGKEIVGAVTKTAAIPAGIVMTGGASIAGQVAAGLGVGYAYDVGQDLIDNKGLSETLTPGVGTMLAGGAPVAVRAAQAGGNILKEPISRVVNTGNRVIESVIPDKLTIEGAKQTFEDIVERVPRFVARQKESIADQALKSRMIKESENPAIKNAIKNELPEKFINTTTQADSLTRQAYREVIDIAEEVPKAIGVRKNPTIVGGERSVEQFDVIDKQRKTIGKAIGEQVNRLGLGKARVDMRVGLAQIDDVLGQQGITVSDRGALRFAGKYTPAERARIQELYTLARESGDVLTPIQVRDMDTLFSKLQRETRMEGIGDLRVDVNGQNMSMFRVFRDVYANQLENLSPELRKLNSQYRNISTLIEDIEDSILKTPNFNITKSTDSAEFAKVNLRRIFGEAQSSPVYEAIADEMDAVARQLGYIGAKPKDVAAFAQELRELYPEITPRTGFAGGIRAGIGDIAEKIFSLGEVSAKDKREALKALLKD